MVGARNFGSFLARGGRSRRVRDGAERQTSAGNVMRASPAKGDGTARKSAAGRRVRPRERRGTRESSHTAKCRGSGETLGRGVRWGPWSYLEERTRHAPPTTFTASALLICFARDVGAPSVRADLPGSSGASTAQAVSAAPTETVGLGPAPRRPHGARRFHPRLRHRPERQRGPAGRGADDRHRHDVALETFDIRTGEIIRVVRQQLDSKNDYVTLGIVGSHVGLVEFEHVTSLFVDARLYFVMNPINANRFTGRWTPPLTRSRSSAASPRSRARRRRR